MTFLKLSLCGLGFVFGTIFGLFVAGELWFLRNYVANAGDNLPKNFLFDAIGLNTDSSSPPSVASDDGNIESEERLTTGSTKQFLFDDANMADGRNTPANLGSNQITADNESSLSQAIESPDSSKLAVTDSSDQMATAEEALRELSSQKISNDNENITAASIATTPGKSSEESVFKQLNGLSIDFQKNSKSLSSGSQQILKEAAVLISKYTHITFEIGGHTDSDGNENYNMDLSAGRANEVLKQLVDFGVNPDQLLSKGYGSSEPVASNNTQQGKKKNRRIEFRALGRKSG